jgi:Zn finger protein HypA/HybF involved in hydrogenase expression
MPLARARCTTCSEPLGDAPHVAVPMRCVACATAQTLMMGADGQPASFEAAFTPPQLAAWFGAARAQMANGTPGVAVGACTKCHAPLAVSSHHNVSLPCPHCRTPVAGEASAVLVDQWPEPWAKAEGGGLSLEYRLAVVDDATAVTAGCARCGLPTPANDPATRCRRCSAITWVTRGPRRYQLGVRVDGTRQGHPFKALVPICQGEQMLRHDAAIGASSESSRSLIGITGIGCAAGTAVIVIPIVLGIVFAIAKC